MELKKVTSKEAKEIADKLINNLFLEIHLEIDVDSGDISPLQDKQVEEFSNLIVEYIKQNGGIKMELKTLDSEKDLELLMEFRNMHFGLWTKFCNEKGYEAEFEED